MRRGWNEGFSYLEVMVAITITIVMATSLSMTFIDGMKLSRLMQAKTELLNVGQAEMEKIRGLPFERVDGYAIETPEARGQVTVEFLTARRKRITVFLRHARESQTLTLVTYRHPHGLNPS